MTCYLPTGSMDALYQRLNQRKLCGLLLLAFLLLCAVGINLSVGSISLSLDQILRALRGEPGLAGDIVWQLRLPRIAMGFLIGWGLAVAGTMAQAVLKNPLASPYTLGMAAGAGFGAVLGILLGQGIGQWIVPGSALAFSLITAGVMLSVSKLKNSTPETLILSGVAVMFLFSALTSFLQYVSSLEELHEIVFWFFGSLSKAGWSQIGISAAMILPPFVLLMSWAWDLNILMAGDESALALGMNVHRIRTAGIAIIALMTAGSICFTGSIGFIGLVAPHGARLMLGSDHRYLLPASGLVGATLLLFADIISRTIWQPQVIPIGIVTSFLGVPFFMFLLMRRHKEYW
jgi:iron complex transport system permease protein